jgi:hypothetical protein
VHSILTAQLVAIRRAELERAAATRRMAIGVSRPTRRFRRRSDCPAP